jgi:hypothetical protein
MVTFGSYLVVYLSSHILWCSFYDENLRDFYTIAGILRLSTKYEVTGLRNRAIGQILTAYPATLQGFDHLLCNPSASRVDAFDGMEIAVVNLGEEINIPQLLPSAYYKLVSQHDDRLLIDGVENPNSPNFGRETLGHRAALRCMMGRNAIRRAMMREIYGFIFGVCPYHVAACLIGRMGALRAIDDGLMAKTLGPFHGPQVDFSGLCSTCQKYITDVHTRLQKQAWERLPSWFELPGWERLLTGDDE